MSASAAAALFRPRACAKCRDSKLKCTWGSATPGLAPCERCARTKSKCVLPILTTRAPRRPRASRVGALEEKIDGIVSLLTAAGARGDITQTPSPVDKGLGSASGSHMATGREEQKEAGPSPAQVILGEQTTTTPDALSLSFQHQDMLLEHFELVPGVRISFGEADRALDEYRTWFSPSFPFVPLPAQASAYDMYMEQPFLFRTIVQVALPQDAQAQQFARRWFRESIAQSVVVRQETRLELLQAMLIFLAWSESGFYGESQTTSLLVQLLAGLAIELGLTRLPGFKHSPYSHANGLSRDALTALVNKSVRPSHHPEEMRAVLGCFYLISTLSTLFRRIHPFPFTSYLAHCCHCLEQEREFPSDLLLVSLIGIQRLVLRCQQADADAPFAPHVPMAMSATRNELESLVMCQPAEVKGDSILQELYHCAIVRIYEPAIYMRQLPDGVPDGTAQRTECLWNCLEACEDLVAAYLASPVEKVGMVPITATACMSFAVVTASRLAFLEDPGWDASLARKRLDLATVVRRIEEYLQAADVYQAASGRKRRYFDDSRSALAMYGDKMRKIHGWYLSRVPDDDLQQDEQRQRQQQARLSEPAAESTAGAGGDVGMTMWPGDLDEAFWQALLLDVDGFRALDCRG